MKAAVISGGGALGAHTVGTLYANSPNYSAVAGVSTGALMAPLVALREYQKLADAYLAVTSKDIFSFNPFTKKGKPHALKIAWRILNGHKTLGTSDQLLKTIRNYYTESDHARLQTSGKICFVSVANMSTGIVEHKDITKMTWIDGTWWMWVSANAPLFMSLAVHDGMDYCDGGIIELFALEEMTRQLHKQDPGFQLVDLFIHRASKQMMKPLIKSLMANALATVGLLQKEIERGDMEAGQNLADHYGITVRPIYLPGKLTSNSLHFDPDQMFSWFMLGRSVVL